jgi:hypothetical protein
MSDTMLPPRVMCWQWSRYEVMMESWRKTGMGTSGGPVQGNEGDVGRSRAAWPLSWVCCKLCHTLLHVRLVLLWAGEQ